MIFSKAVQSTAIVLFALATSFSYAQDRAAPRIIGGFEITEPYSWMVSIQTRTNAPEAFCGGTLIDENWVLTAAHCVEALEPAFIKAVIGTLKKSSDSAESINIDRIVIHPNYREGFEIDNDIALLRLSVPSANTPATLITAEEMAAVTAGTQALVLGWGTQKNNSQVTPEELFGVEIPIRSVAECREMNSSFFDDDIICAGEDAGGQDSCRGDSGGPLLIETGGEQKHAGIVSFGFGDCGIAGQYGVYTKTASYLDWIENQTNGLAVINTPRFGYAIPNINVSHSLTIGNNGESGALLGDAMLSEPNTADFTISADNCQGLLSAGETCSVSLEAQPTQAGVVNRIDLQITTDSQVTPVITSELEVEVLSRLDASSAISDSSFNWYTGGDAGWSTSSTALDGQSLGSGSIGPNESSVLAVNVTGESTLSFQVKVSSEARFDGLEIRRDGQLYRFISGNVDWQSLSINTEGVEVVTFTYTKDLTVDEGSDQAWIENFTTDSGSGGSGGSVGYILIFALLLCQALRCYRQRRATAVLPLTDNQQHRMHWH